MSAWTTPHEGAPPSCAELDAWFARQGLVPSWWSNGPHEVYAEHAHSHHKVLFCAEGSITFSTDSDDFFLTPGDRLDVEPDTAHSAVVGQHGVTCVEAARPSTRADVRA